MKSFKTLLKEAILGNYEYDVPDAKDKRLFDFYMSTSFVKSAAIKDKSFAARNTEEIDYEIDRIKGKLYPELKKDLVDTVFLCIFSEMRHFIDFCVGSATDYRNKDGFDENGELKVYKRDNRNLYENMHPIFKKYIHELMILVDNEGIPDGFEGESGFEATKYFDYKFLEKYNLTRSQLIRIAAPNFLNDMWPSQYGGEAWYNICKGWLGLNQAESIDDMMVWIDHIYDLQHNTNTVLDKSPDYAIKGGHAWIKRALDFKKNIRDPKELLPLVSPKMAEFASIYMKAYRGIHKEDVISPEEAAEAIRLGELGKIEDYMKAGGVITLPVLQQLVAKFKSDIPDFNQVMSIVAARELPKNHSETLSRDAAILLGREVYHQDKTAMTYNDAANSYMDYLANTLILPDNLVSLPLISAASNEQFKAVWVMLEMIYKKYDELSRGARKTLETDLLPYLFGKSLPEVTSAEDYKYFVRQLSGLTADATMDESFDYMYAIAIMISTHKKIKDIAAKVDTLWSNFGTTSDLEKIIEFAKDSGIEKEITDAEFIKEYLKYTRATQEMA